jgi:hypothetical protein
VDAAQGDGLEDEEIEGSRQQFGLARQTVS